VSTSWYPVTEEQWKNYLFYASEMLGLGFKMDDIISLADPGPGKSADKGAKIQEQMDNMDLDFEEGMFADDSGSNIASAVDVCNTIHLVVRIGLDDTDRAYIETLTGAVSLGFPALMSHEHEHLHEHGHEHTKPHAKKHLKGPKAVEDSVDAFEFEDPFTEDSPLLVLQSLIQELNARSIPLPSTGSAVPTPDNPDARDDCCRGKISGLDAKCGGLDEKDDCVGTKSMLGKTLCKWTCGQSEREARYSGYSGSNKWRGKNHGGYGRRMD